MNKWGVAAKAERVIEGCVTIEQLNVALSYIGRVQHLFNKDKKYFEGKIATIYNLHCALNGKYKSIKEKEYFDDWDYSVQLNDKIDKIINPIKKEVMNDKKRG